MKRTAAAAIALTTCLALGCDDDVAPGGDAGVSGDMAMTMPPGPLARFAVIGDYGVDTRDEMDVAKLVNDWHPDYIVTVGDNNYFDGAANTIDANIGQFFAPYIGGYTGKYGPGSPVNRFWPCLGNHDWNATTGAQAYLDYFPSLPGNRRYYDVVVGSVHYFAVDSDVHEPDGIGATSPQAEWLKAALAASTECFNVVFFHHPAYSSGDPLFTVPEMRWPFRDWGADIVLTGHQHQYERLVVGGMTYVVDGLGGALNRFDFATLQQGSLVRYNATFGALFAEVFDGDLLFTFRNTHGDVVDRFDVQRDCSKPHTIVDAGL
jgi:tartrate-resistant acid phosphatase type 5